MSSHSETTKPLSEREIAEIGKAFPDFSRDRLIATIHELNLRPTVEDFDAVADTSEIAARIEWLEEQLKARDERIGALLSALREVGPFEVVTADAAHHTNPGSRLHLNSTESWLVSPRFKTNMEARRVAERIDALLTEEADDG